jgi:hypothetical protein
MDRRSMVASRIDSFYYVAFLCISTHCVSSVCGGWLFDGLLWEDDLQMIFPFHLLQDLVAEC